MLPNTGGSTLFVYHGKAVSEFRAFAAPRLQGVPGDKGVQYGKLWEDVGALQLGATLTYLPPANDVGIFPVKVATKAN